MDNIPTAAIEIPYRLTSALHAQMAMTMMAVGTAVPIIPTPKPWIITVAGPVSPFLAIPCVGASVYDVQYSVNSPIRIPAPKPMMIDKKTQCHACVEKNETAYAEKHTIKSCTSDTLVDRGKQSIQGLVGRFELYFARCIVGYLLHRRVSLHKECSDHGANDSEAGDPERKGNGTPLEVQSSVVRLNCCVARVHAAMIEPT